MKSPSFLPAEREKIGSDVEREAFAEEGGRLRIISLHHDPVSWIR